MAQRKFRIVFITLERAPILIDISLEKWHNSSMSASLEAIEAIYEGGVLKLLNPTYFKEGDKVRLFIEQPNDLNRSLRLPDSPLEDESDAAPFDLPRNSGKCTDSHLGTMRLPNGVGFWKI